MKTNKSHYFQYPFSQRIKKWVSQTGTCGTTFKWWSFCIRLPFSTVDAIENNLIAHMILIILRTFITNFIKINYHVGNNAAEGTNLNSLLGK